MADFLQELLDRARQGMLSLSPHAPTQGQLTGPAIQPTFTPSDHSQEEDQTPGLGYSLGQIAQHPLLDLKGLVQMAQGQARGLANVGQALLPQSMKGVPEAMVNTIPGVALLPLVTGQPNTPTEKPISGLSLGERAFSVVNNSPLPVIQGLPGAVRQAYRDRVAEENSPTIDPVTGKPIINAEQHYLEPAISALGALAKGVLPIDELTSLMRGMKVGADGKEHPITPEEATQELAGFGMKATLLKGLTSKMPSNLNEALEGKNNLESTINKTKSAGEIRAMTALMGRGSDRLVKKIFGEEGLPPQPETGIHLTPEAPEVPFTPPEAKIGEVNGRKALLQEDGKPLMYLDEPQVGQPLHPATDAPTINDENGKPIMYDPNTPFNKINWVHGTTKEARQAIEATGKFTTEGVTRQYQYSEWGPSAIYLGPKNSFWYKDPESARAIAYPEQLNVNVAPDTKIFTIHSVVDADRLAKEIGLTNGRELSNKVFVDPINGDDPVSRKESADAKEITNRIQKAGYDAVYIPDEISNFDPKTKELYSASGPQLVVLNHNKIAPKGFNPSQTITPEMAAAGHFGPENATDKTPPPLPDSNVVQPTVGRTETQQLFDSLPPEKQSVFQQSPMPDIPLVRKATADFVFSDGMKKFMESYDPDDKANNAIHTAVVNSIADPEFQSRVVEDLGDHYMSSPTETRKLIAGSIDRAAEYAGGINHVFADAVKQLHDQAVLDEMTGNVKDRAEAIKIQRLIQTMREKASGASEGWAGVANTLGRIENIRRGLIVSPLMVAIGNAKAQGLTSIMDIMDAANTGMLESLRQAGGMTKDIVTGKDVRSFDTQKQFADVIGAWQGLTSRFPFRRVEYDPNVFGIDDQTFKAIQSDWQGGARGSELSSKYGLKTKQINQIVFGQTQRHVVSDIFDASPFTGKRILGGLNFDTDSKILGPTSNLLSRIIEEGKETYRGAGAKAAWESGVDNLKTAIDTLPIEAVKGENGLIANIGAIGKNTLLTGEMVSDTLNTVNRLQELGFRRMLFRGRFEANLKHINMSMDDALVELNRADFTKNPETGAMDIQRIRPELREALADAEIHALRNTFAFTPEAGLLGGVLSGMKYMSARVFPLTPLGFTFPRFVVNNILWQTHHAPTQWFNMLGSEFRDKLTSTAESGELGRVENMRMLGRATTGLVLMGAAYSMAKGIPVAGYVQGPKPWLLSNGQKDEQGNPKYWDVRFAQPFSNYLILGHITDAAINNKPLNMDAQDWEQFIANNRLDDTPLFSLSENIRNMESQNPESSHEAFWKYPGKYAGSWLNWWKGLNDEGAAIGRGGPFSSNEDILQHRDISHQPMMGNVLKNSLPQILPAKVDPFTGDPDIEKHPAQYIMRSEQKPMTPFEEFMTRNGVNSQTVTQDLKNPIANNRLRQITGLMIQTPEISQAVVKEALGIEGSSISELSQRLMKANLDPEVNKYIIGKVTTVLHTESKKIIEAEQLKRFQDTGTPTDLGEELSNRFSQGIPMVRKDILDKLKALGLR